MPRESYFPVLGDVDAVVVLFDERISKRGPWAIVSTEKELDMEDLQALLVSWPLDLGAPPKIKKKESYLPRGGCSKIFRGDGRLDLTFRDRTMAVAITLRPTSMLVQAPVAGESVTKTRLDAPEQFRPIPLVIIFARTSDEASNERRPTTLPRQILSSAASPPSIISPDFSNVTEVRILGELCSSSAHAARDRHAIARLFEGVPRGTVVLAANPDRLGRRAEDRAFVRSQSRKVGVTVWVQGVPEPSSKEEEAEVDEEERPDEKEPEEERGCRRWIDFDGPLAGQVDAACTDSLVLAHEHGFYTSSARYVDRQLGLEPGNLLAFQEWLASACKTTGTRRILVIGRTSGV